MPNRVKLQETTTPFQELIGWKYSKAEEGHCDCSLEFENKLMNSRQALKSVHGGAIYSLADGAMGGALYSSLSEGEWGTTIGMNIVYFEAVTSGSLSCIARLIHKSNNLATLEAEVMSQGHLVAKATGTWYLFKTNKT
jgi:acyl-CoA thioesterase